MAAQTAQAMRAGLVLCASISLSLPLSVLADSGCEGAGEPYQFDERKRGMGAAHHPTGRPIPMSDAFHTPGRCAEGVWFFDLNGNGLPDAGEPRVFGPHRVVDCGSCHGDSPDLKSADSASVFLRLDASRLCLVCHKL